MSGLKKVWVVTLNDKIAGIYFYETKEAALAAKKKYQQSVGKLEKQSKINNVVVVEVEELILGV